MKTKIRIGCGAGFAGDRLEPAVVLAKEGALDYLILECLAERTIALAQKRKLYDPQQGYDLLLERRMRSLLPILLRNNICLLTNMGAANPIAAAIKVRDIAQQLHLKVKIAVVTGDDVLQYIDSQFIAIETQKPISELGEIIAANAYIGVDGICEALIAKPDIIITGRVADPSLFLAPMIHEFGWKTNDLLGQGTVIGHLLECAGQLTGGYFADGVQKTVENLENLGYPFAEVHSDGTAILQKVANTGGLLNLRTVKEQLLYEVLNPFAYITPDVIANFSTVRLKALNANEVQVSGGTGQEKPSHYKVSVGYKAFYLGEGEITYAGYAAWERAQIAANLLEYQLKSQLEAFRIDYIGINSAFCIAKTNGHPNEIRLRVAGKSPSLSIAAAVGEAVEALYTNGPAAGGGVRKSVQEIIGIVSVLLDRQFIHPKITLFES